MFAQQLLHPHQHQGLGPQKWVSTNCTISANTYIAFWHGTGLNTEGLFRTLLHVGQRIGLITVCLHDECGVGERQNTNKRKGGEKKKQMHRWPGTTRCLKQSHNRRKLLQKVYWLEVLDMWSGRWSLAVWLFWHWRKQDFACSCASSGQHQRHLTPTPTSSFWRWILYTLGFVFSG